MIYLLEKLASPLVSVILHFSQLDDPQRERWFRMQGTHSPWQPNAETRNTLRREGAGRQTKHH